MAITAIDSGRLKLLSSKELQLTLAAPRLAEEEWIIEVRDLLKLRYAVFQKSKYRLVIDWVKKVTI